MADPVETDTSYTGFMKLRKLNIGDSIRQKGDSTTTVRSAGDCTQHGTIVVSVRASLNQHSTVDPELRPHCLQRFNRRFRRSEGTCVRQRKAVEWAEYVAVAVAHSEVLK